MRCFAAECCCSPQCHAFLLPSRLSARHLTPFAPFFVSHGAASWPHGSLRFLSVPKRNSCGTGWNICCSLLLLLSVGLLPRRGDALRHCHGGTRWGKDMKLCCEAGCVRENQEEEQLVCAVRPAACRPYLKIAVPALLSMTWHGDKSNNSTHRATVFFCGNRRRTKRTTAGKQALWRTSMSCTAEKQQKNRVGKTKVKNKNNWEKKTNNLEGAGRNQRGR